MLARGDVATAQVYVEPWVRTSRRSVGEAGRCERSGMKSFKVVRKNIGTLPGQMRGWLSLQGNRDLCADMAELFRRSASTGCTYHELGTLYRHIIRHRPRHVLELGSGMSTLVLAHAARLVRDQGGECQVISMEEDSFYFNNLMSLLPAWVSDYATVVHSPLRDE